MKTDDNKPGEGRVPWRPFSEPAGAVLLAAFVIASVAAGWYTWRTLADYAHVPAERTLARQSALMAEIGALRAVERALDDGGKAALDTALRKARVVMRADGGGDPDIQSARAEANDLLGALARASGKDPGQTRIRLRHAVTALENATLAANEEIRRHLAVRNERLAALRLAAQLTFLLLGAGAFGIVTVLAVRARDSGRLERALDAVQDREQKLAVNRQELASKTRLLQTTLDSIDQGFAVWDNGYRLVAFNAKCLDFWQHPAGVYPGMAMLDLLRHLAETGAFGDTSRAEEMANRNFDRVIAAGPESEEEFFLGDGRIIHINRYPMPDGGHASVYTDVTDERTAADVLEQAKLKAELANKAKSEFLSAMSHELRTPMNAVLGFGQLLQDDPNEPLSPRQAESVAHILTAGGHLLELINEVLDLAKIEAGKMVLDVGPVDVHELLQETAPLTETLADRRGVTISYPDLFAPGPVVAADSKRLRQVMVNLLSNAVKYNADKGAVSVELSERPGGLLRIAVADTGPGIPEDKMDGLFQPFNRLGAEGSDIEGTGIGLTICRELVENMGGEIGVTSRPGDGSVFWVDLPLSGADLAASAVVEHGPEAVSGPLEGERTVLYIEDHPANRQLMERLIERMDGVTLRTATTGEEGLALIAEQRPDLLLLDINLPGIKGYDVLAQLRQAPETETLPIIAVTAQAMDDDIRKGLEAGFDAYLAKPLDLTRAGNIIRGMLGAGETPVSALRKGA